MKEVKWKDPRKNIYTVTVTRRNSGSVAIIETHSNKKKAWDRFHRLTSIYVDQKQGHDDANAYRVDFHQSKLQRKSLWE